MPYLYHRGSNGIGPEVMSRADKVNPDDLPAYYFIGNQCSGSIEMAHTKENIGNSNRTTELVEYLHRKLEERANLDNLYDHLISLSEGKPLTKKLLLFEAVAKEIAENDDFIKSYIFTCSKYTPSELSSIYKKPDIFNEILTNPDLNKELNDISKTFERVIDNAGGYYLYFKKNRKLFFKIYPHGVPPQMKFQDWLSDKKRKFSISGMFQASHFTVKHSEDIPPFINFFNRLMDQIYKIENEMENIDKHKPVVIKYNDDDFIVKISWDRGKKEFLRQKRLLQKQEISFNPLSIHGKPYFKRGDEAKAAASLFIFWHENEFITGLRKSSKGRPGFNIDIITDSFSLNANKEFNKRALRDALQKVDKKDKNKLHVFANLLKKK